MGPIAKNALRTLALRLAKDPTAATVEDVRKMARGLLMLIDGRLSGGK